MYESVAGGAELDARVLVYAGGKLDVKLRVESPEGRVLYQALLFSNLDDKGRPLDVIVKKGAAVLAAASGTYAVCVDNRMAKYTAKSVVLDVAVRDPNSPAARAARAAAAAGARAAADAAKAGASPGAASPLAAVAAMRAACARILDALQRVESAQLYAYHRERRHKATIESTNARVVAWTLAESGAIVAATAAQVGVMLYWFRHRAKEGARGYSV